MANDNSKKVAKTVRDAIVKIASEARSLQGRSGDIAKKFSREWKDSKPGRDKAQKDAKRIARQIVEFSRSVAEGVKDGIRDVRKKKAR